MDKLDYKILNILKENGRETASDISKAIHLSVSAVLLSLIHIYLKEAGMEVQLFEGVEPDPSVDTVLKGRCV